MSNLCYLGLVAAQVITFCGYVVVTAGAALLQKKANTLTLWDDPAQVPGNTLAYNDVFQSSQYIIPYPQQPKYQFQYQWWIIEFQLAIFVLTAGLTLFPSMIERARPVALTFIASAFVLVMDNINSIFFLLRNDTAKMVFDEYRIATAQAGLLIVGCANCLTIIFLGLYQHEAPAPQNAGKAAGQTVTIDC